MLTLTLPLPVTRAAGGAQPGSHWMLRWKQSCARGPELPAELRAAHAAFDAAYVDFVRKVVLPNLADPKGILFQRRPTFRCHLAGGGQPTGRPHCDSEYGHQRGELNFWLPLTRVSGSNSLYSESAPGRGGARGRGRGLGVEMGLGGGIGIGFGLGLVIELGIGIGRGRRQGACQTTSP